MQCRPKVPNRSRRPVRPQYRRPTPRSRRRSLSRHRQSRCRGLIHRRLPCGTSPPERRFALPEEPQRRYRSLHECSYREDDRRRVLVRCLRLLQRDHCRLRALKLITSGANAAPHSAPPLICHNLCDTRCRAAAPPNQAAARKMLIGAPPKWSLTGRVCEPYTRSGAGPMSPPGRKRSEAIGRQPHGNPPARQAAGAHTRYRRHLRAPGEKPKTLYHTPRPETARLKSARLPHGISARPVGIAKSLFDAIPSCHNVWTTGHARGRDRYA